MARMLGRRPPKNAPALRLAPLLTGTVPEHPASQDNLHSLTGWKVLGNDVAGDCVAVTWASFRRLVTAALAGREVYPTQAQVWQVYQTQNPGFDPNGTADSNGPGSDADQGMDIQTVLEYLAHTGGPDGVKLVAFAKVDHTSLDEVKAALAIFGGVWVGINVQAANQQQFSRRQPWDYVSGSPNEGGHSVLAGGYLGSTTDDVTFITWGAETGFTDSFWAHLVEEAWVAIWPEHLGSAGFTQGISLDALAADYLALTGRTLPLPSPSPAPPPFPVPPAPTPTPAPVPAPQVDDADRYLARAVTDWAHARHSGPGSRVAQAFRAWLKAKGL